MLSCNLLLVGHDRSRRYGEVTPAFVDRIISETDLKAGRRFLDIGSGVGNVVMQVAAQSGCEAVGIEQVELRHRLAKDFQKDLAALLNAFRQKTPNVTLHHARFEELEQRADVTDGKTAQQWLNDFDVIFTANNCFDEAVKTKVRCALCLLTV